MKKYLLFAALALVTTTSSFAQQRINKDTTILGWLASYSLPSDYATSGKAYPLWVFFPGIGEVGSYAGLKKWGPLQYISRGWNGKVNVAGQTDVIYLALSQSPSYDIHALSKDRVNEFIRLFRVNKSNVVLSGISAGGHCAQMQMTEDPFDSVAPYGPFKYADGISAVVVAQGVTPDDNKDYLNQVKNYVRNNLYGRYLGIWGTGDASRKIPEMVKSMNASINGSAIELMTVDKHDSIAWKRYFGGLVAPNKYLLDGVMQNVYEWGIRQGDTLILPSVPPVSILSTSFTDTIKQAVKIKIITTATASFTASNLPSGLSITTDGVITGTVQNSGTYTVNVTATNPGGAVVKPIALTFVPKEIERYTSTVGSASAVLILFNDNTYKKL